MSKARLFQSLRILLGGECSTDFDGNAVDHDKRLTDAQVAAVVRDVVYEANGEEDNISLSLTQATYSAQGGNDYPDVCAEEFCNLIATDSNVLTLLQHYRDREGDDKMLTEIMRDPIMHDSSQELNVFYWNSNFPGDAPHFHDAGHGEQSEHVSFPSAFHADE